MGHDKAGNLVELLEKAVSAFPQDEAIAAEGIRLNYTQLNGEINKLAGALRRLGVKKGDRVLVMAPNGHHFVVAYFAILKAGGVVVPANIFLKGEELEYMLEHSGAGVAIVFSRFVERFREIKKDFNIISFGEYAPGTSSWEGLTEKEKGENIPAEIDPDDTAVIIYTSGTTGKPKGAMLSHSNLTSNVSSITRAFGSTQPEVMLCVLPLFHAFAATVCMLFPISIGSKIVVMTHFHPHQALENIVKERVTIFPAVPTIYGMLSEIGDTSGMDFSSWRICVSGGAALPPEIMKRFEEKFPVRIYEGDGPTECSPVTSVNPIGGKRKIGSIGLPVPDVKMKIVDNNGNTLPPEKIGEIAVKGSNVMKGYFKDPAATKESIKDGWFHTGDIGKVDEEGYFYILDRKKDMVIVGGLNVYPREVEDVIYTHPSVKEVAVIASPDKKSLRGEIPKAFVVLKEGMKITSKELIRFCHQHLAGFKIPRVVEFCKDLPKTASGKIHKLVLREKEWGKKGG